MNLFSMEKNIWYKIDNADKIDTPALVIYPERVKENIRILKEIIDDPLRLRPHVKTHKTKEATLLIMEAGISKFKCATIAEAEMLGMCIAPDVLLAYPLFGPKLERFVCVIKKFPDTVFSCLADNETPAKEISETAVANDLNIRVYIDLNVGMYRTGIKPGKSAVKLYEDCSKLKRVQVKGFHIYDGHIRERDIEKRFLLCRETFTPVKEMISELISKGYQRPEVIIGGSPSFPIYAKQKDVECSPGTFIFWDKGYTDS